MVVNIQLISSIFLLQVMAFYFPYMEPGNPLLKDVVRKYYDGDLDMLFPVGPSPIIIHKDTLKKIAKMWYELSVELKADRAADAAFGWALEMWGYSPAPHPP